MTQRVNVKSSERDRSQWPKRETTQRPRPHAQMNKRGADTVDTQRPFGLGGTRHRLPGTWGFRSEEGSTETEPTGGDASWFGGFFGAMQPFSQRCDC